MQKVFKTNIIKLRENKYYKTLDEAIADIDNPEIVNATSYQLNNDAGLWLRKDVIDDLRALRDAEKEVETMKERDSFLSTTSTLAICRAVHKVKYWRYKIETGLIHPRYDKDGFVKGAGGWIYEGIEEIEPFASSGWTREEINDYIENVQPKYKLGWQDRPLGCPENYAYFKKDTPKLNTLIADRQKSYKEGSTLFKLSYLIPILFILYVLTGGFGQY